LIALALFLTPAALMAGFSIDDVFLNEGDAGIVQMVFTVSLDACLVSFCSVTVETDDDTATAGSDYIFSALVFNSLFNPNLQEWLFSVPVVSDDVTELNERLFALLSSAIGATIDDAGGTGDIVNDDSAQIIMIEPSPESEDQAGTLDFRFHLSGPVDRDVTARARTFDGEATLADGDYAPRTYTMIFFSPPDPPTEETVSISINVDSKVEMHEDFLLVTNILETFGRDVTCPDCTGVGTILNDDAATIVIEDLAAPEGDAGTSVFNFDVTLDMEVDVGVDVDFATADGTATEADNDYEGAIGTLLFSGTAGEMESVNITVNGDTDVEPDEDFFVDLSNIFASGRDVTFADSQGKGIILSDDGVIFCDGFESGDTSAWSSTAP
jgi:hypothetical protein